MATAEQYRQYFDSLPKDSNGRAILGTPIDSSVFQQQHPSSVSKLSPITQELVQANQQVAAEAYASRRDASTLKDLASKGGIQGQAAANELSKRGLIPSYNQTPSGYIPATQTQSSPVSTQQFADPTPSGKFSAGIKFQPPSTLGGQVGSAVGGIAGSVAGSATASSVFGSQSGFGAMIGGGIGGIIGGAIAGGLVGTGTGGLGSVAAYAAGSLFGSFVGSFIGGGLDALGNWLWNNKPKGNDKGKNYINLPSSSVGQSQGVLYRITVQTINTSGQLTTSTDNGFGALGGIFIENGMMKLSSSSGESAVLLARLWEVKDGDPANVQIVSIVRADGQPDSDPNVTPNNSNPFSPNNPSPVYVPPPFVINAVNQNDQDKNFVPRSQQEKSDPSPELAPNQDAKPNPVYPDGVKDPTPNANSQPKAGIAPNSPVAPTGKPNSPLETRSAGNTQNRTGTVPTPSASNPLATPERIAQPTPSPIKQNPTGTPNTPPSPDFGAIALGITALGITTGSVLTGVDYLKNKADKIDNQTSSTAQQTNAKQGVCDAMQPQQCGYEGVKQATAEATDPIKQTATANNGLLQTLLGLLQALNTFLLSNIGKILDLLNRQVVDRVLAITTFAMTLHNALMLSQGIGDTVGSIVDSILNLTGLSFKNSEGATVGAGEVIGANFRNFMISVIGQENYTTLSTTFAQANRIYQAGMNIVNNVQSILDSAASVAQSTGINVAKIGNALRDNHVVSPREYEHMDDSAIGNRPTKLSRFQQLTTTISDADSNLQNLASITGSVVSIKDSVKQSKDDIKAFNDARDANSQANKDAKEAIQQQIKELKPLTEITIAKREEDN